MITTCLHDWELNVPLKNNELQKLLEEVRIVTKTDWQVTSITITNKRWFRKPTTKTLYSIYYPVRGCMPWQMINMYGENGRMCLRFSEHILAAYLMGLLNGAVMGDDTK
jgi:hypothetical protein